MKSRLIYLLIALLIPIVSFSQSRRHPLEGMIYLSNNDSIQLVYSGGDRIEFNYDNEHYLDFFSSLTFCKIGKKQLVHLLKTRSKVTVDISEKICLLYKDSSYRIVAGLTGVGPSQSDSLIPEYYQPRRQTDVHLVHEQNTLTIYLGCLKYIENPLMKLDSNNVILFNGNTNKLVAEFSIDTIVVQPFMNPDLLYKNKTELYIFAGIHEIEHLKPENIALQLSGGLVEYEAMRIETKAFKRRRKINRKSSTTKIKSSKNPRNYSEPDLFENN